MDEMDSKLNEECLLLAYYFGRIKLLNCVALQRITQDLISAFESPPDNRSTKYTEPIDGCCLCEEKEALFKKLLNRHENTTTERSGIEQTKDLEKSWKEVSEMWNKILVQTEGLGKDRPKFDVGQACQNLLQNHGLEVFGEEEYNRDSLDTKWQTLTMGIKNKLEACNYTISRINGKAKLPTNPGPNVTKWVMRNVYLTLATKKAARTHAKFMQNCRKVGLQIRAARDPVSVIAKLTLCTLCIRMGNKHKAIDLAKLLNTGISYLETNVTLDDFPDTEPTFGDDEKWRRLLKCATKSSSVANEIEAAVPIVQNNNLSTSVRRSDRVPTAKKKNGSFFYYDNGVFTNQEDSCIDEPIKQRRASPVHLTTPASSSVANLSRTPTSTVAEVTSENLTLSDENSNAVIVSAEHKPTSVAHSSDSTTSTSLAPSSGVFKRQEDSSSVMPAPHSLVPSGIDLPLQKVTAPISFATSIAPSCGDGQRKDVTSIMNPLRSPGIDPAQRKAAVILTKIAQSLQPRENNKRPLEAASKPKVIPITPSSLAQLVSNPHSQKVIFFQANNFSKGVDLKKTSLKMNTAMTPIVRSRSVSFDSSQAQKMLFQTIKPRATESTVPKPTRKTSQKKPFLVQIVNGKIHKPNGAKVTRTAVMKSIPLSRNHVKFVRSVSLKNSVKTFYDPGKSAPVQGVASTVSTDSIPRTLVLGGDMKRGSIMHVGPLSNPPTSIPQFQLGKSFTFQTKSFPIRSNINPTGTGADHIATKKSAGNAPKKVFYAAVRSRVGPVSAAPSVPKKSNPNCLSSPSKTPTKKKRLLSKSMPTVVAEHIFSLMPSSDPNLWKKLNTKNIRRSEKNNSLIPVPYETNFLCIHDTLDNFGWKAYWYRKCRCSRIREKAAETDSEYHDEPSPMDVAAWLPKQVTETMRKTLNLFVENDDHVMGAGLPISNSPPKEKSTPTVRVLLEDCAPKCNLERDVKNIEKVNFESVDETESVDIETVDDNTDVVKSSSGLIQKPCNLSPETTKKMPILTLKAKYRKDKNGNWTAMINNDQTSDSQKCGNDAENASRDVYISNGHEDVKNSQKCENDAENASKGAYISNGHEDVKKSEDSVMLNIQPGLSFANRSSTVAMEDRVGTTSDHGIRRCPRATMARRKALVRRAFDAETRFKTKRERAESSASDCSLFGSFRDESLTDPTFDVVSAHPMCFREEPEFYSKISALQAKHLEYARTLSVKDNTRQAKLYEAGRVEDSVMAFLTSPICPMPQAKVKKIQSKNTVESPVMTLLSSPACPTLRARVKKIQPKKSTAIASNNKTTKGDLVNKLECIWGKTKNVSIRSKNTTCSNDAKLMEPSISFNKDKVLTENWNLSDCARKVVNQISPEVAFTDLQTLRGVPSTAPSSNIISEKHAQFVTAALQVLDKEHPVVVLTQPIPKVNPNIKAKTQLQPPTSESECLPTWMQKIKTLGEKSKLDVVGEPTVESQKLIPRVDPTFVCEPSENTAATLKKLLEFGTTPENCTDITACQNYAVTDAKNCEQGACEREIENHKEVQIPDASEQPVAFPLPSSPKILAFETAFLANSQPRDEISSGELWIDVAEEQSGEVFSAEGIDSGIMSPKKSTKSEYRENCTICIDKSTDLPNRQDDDVHHSTKMENGEVLPWRNCFITPNEVNSDLPSCQDGDVYASTKMENGEVLPWRNHFITPNKENSDMPSSQDNDVYASINAVLPLNHFVNPIKENSDLPSHRDDDFYASTKMERGEVSPWRNHFITPNEVNSDLASRHDVCASTNMENGAVLPLRNHFIIPNKENSNLPSRQENDVCASTKMENGAVSPWRNHFSTSNKENSDSKRQKLPENLAENAKTAELFVITSDTDIDKICDENENTQNHHIPVLALESKTPTEFHISKPSHFVSENNAESGAKLKPQEPQRSKDKKHGNLIPTFFAIHRDLRTMLRMSKRGSLVHLSLSRTGKDSVLFKKHLRKRLKASRRLSALLSNRYDLKRVLSKVTKEGKETPKRLGAKGSQKVKKSVKFKSKKSTRKSPLSNMLNWIWDVSDDRNVELAKYMPVSYNAPFAVNTEPKSRECTPETVRGPFFSKLGDPAATCKDLLPGDFKTSSSPKVHEASSEVEPSPSSSGATSPKQRRKRGREDSNSLDGMYWSNLLDYEGVEPHRGINLQGRRIVDEDADVDEKVPVNKRKRSGYGFLMSDFNHARRILQADKASFKKYNTQKSNSEWEDEEATTVVPLHTLLSRSLNVERIRSWIWDSTSPTPMILLALERSANRKRLKLLKRRYSETMTQEAISTRDTLQTANTMKSEADNGNWKQCDPRDAQKSEIKDSFERFLDGAERGHAPLMRCSLPQYCPPSPPEILPPPPEKKLFLVRRTEKGSKNSDSSRPVGLTKAAKTGVRGKINFHALFGKLRKERRTLRNKDGLNKFIFATDNAETEVVVDDDETPQGSGDTVYTVLLGTPGGDRVTNGDVSPGCEVRNCRLKLVKIDERVEASMCNENEETEIKRHGTTTCKDGDETKLQALRETVFAELKRKGNATPVLSGRVNTGTDRRRPLLQSRCSTKGTFISRLLECDTECLLSNDVIKS